VDITRNSVFWKESESFLSVGHEFLQDILSVGKCAVVFLSVA
jgi:hypothetical protein